MKPPVFVRELTATERHALRTGLRRRDAFTRRRAQTRLARADGLHASGVAARIGCGVGTVGNTLHAFERDGVRCVGEKKRAPNDSRPILDAAHAGPLEGILHPSPRRFGTARSTGTRDLLADVTCDHRRTPRGLSHEAVRRAVRRAGHGWKRAETGITRPGPACPRETKPATG